MSTGHNDPLVGAIGFALVVLLGVLLIWLLA